MSDAKDQTLSLNVRLKPSEPSGCSPATNDTNIRVAQGINSVNCACNLDQRGESITKGGAVCRQRQRRRR